MLNGLVRDDHSARREVVEDGGAIAAFASMVRSDQNIGADKLGAEVRALQQRLPTCLLQIAGKQDLEVGVLNEDN